MTKGIVVEVKKRHLIVLSEGGEFRKVKIQNRSYSVGSDIFLPNESTERRSYQLPRLDWKKTAVFMVALVLLFFQFAPYTGQGVYAYVGMEINPSIELEIDDSMLVQGINAYNTDGKKLVSLLEDWENEHIEIVTDQIFKICRAKGYIKPNQEVIVTTTLNKDVSKEIQQKIERKINTLMEKKAEENAIDMTSLIMSNEDRKRAEQLKVSPGKYAIFMAAKQAGYNITKTDIRYKSIQELSKAVGSFSDLFSSTTLGGQQHVAVFIHTKPVNQQNTLSTEPIYTNPVTIVVPPGQTNNNNSQKPEIQPTPVSEKPAVGNTASPVSPVQETPASKGEVAAAPAGPSVQTPTQAPAPVNTAPASPAKEPSTAPIVEPVKQTLPLPKPDVLPTVPVKEPVKPAVIPPSKEDTKGGGMVIALPKDKEGDKHTSTVIPPKDVPAIPAVPKEEPKPSKPEGKCGHRTDKTKEQQSSLPLPLPKPEDTAAQPLPVPVKEPEIKKDPIKVPEASPPSPYLQPVKSPQQDQPKETKGDLPKEERTVSQPGNEQVEKKEEVNSAIDSQQEPVSSETEEPSNVELDKPEASEEVVSPEEPADMANAEPDSQTADIPITPSSEPAATQDPEVSNTPQDHAEAVIDHTETSDQATSKCGMPTIETFNEDAA